MTAQTPLAALEVYVEAVLENRETLAATALTRTLVGDYEHFPERLLHALPIAAATELVRISPSRSRQDP